MLRSLCSDNIRTIFFLYESHEYHECLCSELTENTEGSFYTEIFLNEHGLTRRFTETNMQRSLRSDTIRTIFFLYESHESHECLCTELTEITESSFYTENFLNEHGLTRKNTEC